MKFKDFKILNKFKKFKNFQRFFQILKMIQKFKFNLKNNAPTPRNHRSNLLEFFFEKIIFILFSLALIY